jgi:multisubunit Na+/H+ antiporter MnhB subunit
MWDWIATDSVFRVVMMATGVPAAAIVALALALSWAGSPTRRRVTGLAVLLISGGVGYLALGLLLRHDVLSFFAEWSRQNPDHRAGLEALVRAQARYRLIGACVPAAAFGAVGALLLRRAGRLGPLDSSSRTGEQRR